MSNKVPRHLLGGWVSWDPHSTLSRVGLHPFWNIRKCLLPSLTAKSCPVDKLTFVEDQKDAEEKYPPYSCIITATSLQNKVYGRKSLCLHHAGIFDNVEWFSPCIFRSNMVPKQACSDDANQLINTGNKPLWQAFSKDWFCCSHPQGSTIQTEILQRKRGGKPQYCC